MIYIIGGQTASGKTNLALKLATLINGQIINADAFQVYRGLDIGTAKPTKEEQEMVTHHLIDIINPNEEFSIYQFQKLSRNIINELLKKGITPIIVGGSALYIRAMLYDYSFSDNKKVDLSRFENLTKEELHEELYKIDPESARLIHKNNQRRVLRAIEIYLQTGNKKSSIEKEQSVQPVFDYKMVALSYSKEELSTRIKQRIELMFEKGFVNEALNAAQNYPIDSPGLKAIGYLDIINDTNSNETELKEVIANKTIKYAKRQMTFFKNKFDIKFFTNSDDALKYLIKGNN